MINVISARDERHVPSSRFVLTVFSILTAITLLLVFTSSAVYAAGKSSFHVPEKFVQNRILLQPRAGLTQEKLDAIINRTGGRVTFLMEEIDLHVL
ncbi:MAG: hypothetical protein GWN45_09245, partial [Gammaproteobacteria bacterium]|nr:hypothetical protein [Gammaproteobacteria bacterium]NIW11126.1 hypothetical protein [Gammaproteobacteria bacterium]NIW45577.1 hypothetical protein [Gammaproteobacteria bacterium]